jgi:hypothetical protein
MQPLTSEGSMRLFEMATGNASKLWINLDAVVRVLYAVPDGKPAYLSLTLQNGSYDVIDRKDIDHVALILGISIPEATAAP